MLRLFVTSVQAYCVETAEEITQQWFSSCNPQTRGVRDGLSEGSQASQEISKCPVRKTAFLVYVIRYSGKRKHLLYLLLAITLDGFPCESLQQHSPCPADILAADCRSLPSDRSLPKFRVGAQNLSGSYCGLAPPLLFPGHGYGYTVISMVPQFDAVIIPHWTSRSLSTLIRQCLIFIPTVTVTDSKILYS